MKWTVILLAIGLQAIPKLEPTPDVHLAAGIHAARALERPTAGMSIAVARDGSTPHVVRAFGFADVDGKVRTSPNTIFRIGELSREVAAAAASFQSLGMTSTLPCDTAKQTGHLATGYDVVAGALVAATPQSAADATELCSTPADLIKWQRAVGSGRITSGARSGSLDGRRVTGYAGSGRGFSSALAYFPEQRLTIVVLGNTATGVAESVAASIARSAFELGPGPDTLFASPQQTAPLSGNPILQGWYADPEAHVFENQYWIYPTYSARYDQQTFMDAFSSRDLLTWTKHPRILDAADVPWARRAMWAPSIVEKDGWYYLFFGANDIQNDQQVGGIGVARARQPAGPFKDYLGKPLIDKFHNGAQPIDQFVFKDRDGAYYIVYGGWRHCNIARLNADFTGFVPFPDGSVFREITPQGYVEGAFMLLKDGKYYFMWSEGGWTGPNYAVAYAVGSSPFGPFERVGRILQQDPQVATGAGHHSVLRAEGSGKWYIVYHRRPLGETDRDHRVVCIDELTFDEKGMIVPVRITSTGVAMDPLPVKR